MGSGFSIDKPIHRFVKQRRMRPCATCNSVHLLAAVGEARESEFSIMGVSAYKKDINGFLPMHIRLLNLFDL
jgi:hypothetical protein